VYACPKCGSRKFSLVWNWKLEIPDGLEFRENRAIIQTGEDSGWDPWDPQYISHAVCTNCGSRISKNKIRRIFERTEVKYL
jgi:DNA-directed RNA polymerase subunit RPC12/RpoP